MQAGTTKLPISLDKTNFYLFICLFIFLIYLFTEAKVDASIHVKFAVVNMDGYETDEILSQALDLAEDVENDTIFIIQVGKNIEWRTSTHVQHTSLSKRLLQDFSKNVICCVFQLLVKHFMQIKK
jgi:hypothetical protein